ncbi:MAG TPA: element excision factor XisH family protein [Blastocatellia bacterium]|nr:element excision factor XisH family protein [Blastocatellia bacterium]
MPKLDIIHNAVKNALIKDGWTITHDPFIIDYKELTLYADLAAERPIAAERAGRKIVVEVKSFVGASKIQDLKIGLGQYEIYVSLLEITDPKRKLYIAISEKVYDDFFTLEAIQVIINRLQVPLIVVNPETEEIVKWTS